MSARPRLTSRLAAAVLALLLAPWVASAAPAPAVSVVVEGLAGEAAENVDAYLSLRQTPPASEDHLRRLFRRAPGEIRRALQAVGHYRPQIQSALERREEGGWVARFRVEPGPPVQVGALDLRLAGEGADDPAFAALRRRFPVVPGEVFHHGRYEQGKRALQSLAAERGYFDARFTAHRAQVNVEAARATVVLHFDTGPRYRLGPVRFEQDVLDPDFLARFVPFRAGDPYTAAKVVALQDALVDSDYFREVQVEQEREGVAGLEVPVRVRLTPRAPNRYSAGLGVGTDTGPRASLGWERRRINRRGHRMRAGLELSPVRSGIDASYEIPLARPLTDRLALRGRWEDESTDTSDSTRATLSVQRVVSRPGGWVETLSANLLQESYTIAGEAADSTLLYPGLQLSRLRADDRLYPRRGSRVSLELRGSDPVLGSDTRFLQARADGKWVRGLGARGRVLLRGAAGVTHVEDFGQLPASLRFFAGGDQSVRGYGYQALGPEDTEGEVVGGRYLLVGSVEYEHRLRDKWSAAVFYDAGNAYDEPDTELAHGVGVGLRWRSPVGPIRLDVAVAVSEPDRPLRLHVHMGPDL